MYILKPKQSVSGRRFATCLDVSDHSRVMAVVEKCEGDGVCTIYIYKQGDGRWHVRASIHVQSFFSDHKVEVPVSIGVSETGNVLVLTTNLGYRVYTQERACLQWSLVAIRAYPRYMNSGFLGLSVTVSKNGDYAMLTTNTPHNTSNGVTLLVITKSTGYTAGLQVLQTKIHAPSNTYVNTVTQSTMDDALFAVQITAHTPTKRTSSVIVVCSHTLSTVRKRRTIPVNYCGYSIKPKPSVSKVREVVTFIDTNDEGNWMVRICQVIHRGSESRVYLPEHFTPTGTVLTNSKVSTLTLHGVCDGEAGKYQCILRLTLDNDYKVLSTYYIDTGEIMGTQSIHQVMDGTELICGDPTESNDVTHSGSIQIHSRVHK